MSPLTGLPNELWVKILFLLDPDAINNLCALPEFSTRLADLVCVFSDTLEYKHANITSKFHLEEVHRLTNLQESCSLAVIELHESMDQHAGLSDANRQRRISNVAHTRALSAIVHSHIFLYSNSVSGVRQGGGNWSYPDDFDRFMDRLSGSRTLAICFAGIEYLKVLSPKPSGPQLLFPKLQHLDVLDPRSQSIGSTFGPSIQSVCSVTTRGSVDWANDLKFFHNSNLEEIELHNDQTLVRWKEISLPRVCAISIEAPRLLRKFSGGVYERLESLKISNCASLSLVRDLNMPLLTVLEISTQKTLKLANVSAPKLRYAVFDATSLRSFSNVEFPSLWSCKLELSCYDEDELFESCKFAWLSSVQQLSITEFSDVLFYATNVEFLTVSLGLLPLTSKRYNLPRLTDLRMDCTMVSSFRWPFTNSRDLKSLDIRLQSVEDMYAGLVIPEEFGKWHPYLEKLKMSGDGMSNSYQAPMIKVSMHDIKLFSLSDLSFDWIAPDIRWCTLPNLTQFGLYNCQPESVQYNDPVAISLNAPILESCEISNAARVGFLDLAMCISLQNLHIHQGKVEKMLLPNITIPHLLIAEDQVISWIDQTI